MSNAAGCDSTVTTVLVVNQLPAVTLDPVIDVLCTDDPVETLVGSPAGGTFSGIGVSGSTFDPSLAGAGMHEVIYDYTDGNGCSASDTITIEVEVCAGIAPGMLDNVQLYPSPNAGLFTIEGLPLATPCQVYDARGKLVLDFETNSELHQVSLPPVAEGTYYLRATTDDGSKTFRFIVREE